MQAHTAIDTEPPTSYPTQDKTRTQDEGELSKRVSTLTIQNHADSSKNDPRSESAKDLHTEPQHAPSPADGAAVIEKNPHVAPGMHDQTKPYISEPDHGSSGKETDPSAEANTENEAYKDPTPKTPRQGVSPTRENRDESMDEEVSSNPEIQSIMEQFDLDNQQAESGSQYFGAESLPTGEVQHPPRTSSLETSKSNPSTSFDAQISEKEHGEFEATTSLGSPAEDGVFTPLNRLSSLPAINRIATKDEKTPLSPQSSISFSTLPPVPDPEPDLPFDFQRFLEQLRHRTADPVAKYLRSFLIEFGRKQWMVHEQVKLINDFLAFITNKMARCEVWKGVSDAEFDNAREGMEKLVMNRLYAQTFSPAIPAPTPAPPPKGKRNAAEPLQGPGRRGQHQEDIERDEVLAQKIKIYGWVEEEHLDIPRVSDNGRGFLILAQKELLKIKTYRAPRDKVICVLNCCKVIFGTLRKSKTSDTSADSFVPLLIYVVLHANPDHLVSNVQYILRFRNQDKLNGEAGYYLSSLMGAIQFIENLDKTSLTISDQEFEKHVEAAVSMIAEKHQEAAQQPRLPPRPPSAPLISEKSGLSQPEVIPRNSIDAEYSSPRRPVSSMGPPGNKANKEEENTAVSGLLRTIQKPLTTIGRVFNEELGSQSNTPAPPQQPQRLSPAVFQPPPGSSDTRIGTQRNTPHLPKPGTVPQDARRLSAEQAAANQASAEAAEAQRIQRAEHQNVVETLAGMFPGLDREVIDDVVRQKQGRVGLAVDACLALSS